MASKWAVNCETGVERRVWWYELCGRGAISFKRTRPVHSAGAQLAIGAMGC